MKLPRTLYLCLKDFGREGIGVGGDPTEDLDAALDQAVNSYSDKIEPFVILQLESDPDTGRVERIDDVTEDAIAQRNELLDRRGIDPIAAE
jgi:hypothetical protein